MNKTSIGWTDFTANPLKFRAPDGRIVWACEKLSAGCKNCYAERLSTRYGGVRRAGEWNAATMATLTPFVDEKELHAIHWSKAITGKRVFVGDMTDLFGEWVSDIQIAEVFTAMEQRPDVTFQVLTKRAARLARLWVKDIRPVRNVWIGVSVEDQAAADERIPLLLQTPAAVRFISAEPLLGPIDLTRLDWSGALRARALAMAARQSDATRRETIEAIAAELTGPARLNALTGARDDGEDVLDPTSRLDWVIVGGESGAKFRRCDPDWIGSIAEQCEKSGTPVFVKQGAHRLPGKPVGIPETDALKQFPETPVPA